jgi:hypothetical protein
MLSPLLERENGQATFACEGAREGAEQRETWSFVHNPIYRLVRLWAWRIERPVSIAGADVWAQEGMRAAATAALDRSRSFLSRRNRDDLSPAPGTR